MMSVAPEIVSLWWAPCGAHLGGYLGLAASEDSGNGAAFAAGLTGGAVDGSILVTAECFAFGLHLRPRADFFC